MVESLSHPVHDGAQLLAENGPEKLALLLEAEALVRHHLGHVRLALLHVVRVGVVHGVAALPRKVRHQQSRLLSAVCGEGGRRERRRQACVTSRGRLPSQISNGYNNVTWEDIYPCSSRGVENGGASTK